ncbi:Alanine_racemase [Hexamita inflata]|uniref:Pyridoxal phosphate homeostasis protein n=1 Tax=Hexamita inflata TaxID=28002 RepID=A0AA86VRN9_9EUKA|nr:Alanine racemase [Hexamita inflata]
MTIQENLQEIRQSLQKFDNPPTLIAVSKTKPNEAVQEAYDAGQRIFGENYVQELCDKVPALPRDIEWHFIGHLQSNKSNMIAKLANDNYKIVVQTLDSAKLADKLNSQLKVKLDVMVEVHTSTESSKSGCSPSEVLALVDHIKSLPNLNFVGLMTIGDPNDPRSCFKQMKDLQAQTKGSLSMGMSGDYKEAVEFGTNFVRIGTAIFGHREYKK